METKGFLPRNTIHLRNVVYAASCPICRQHIQLRQNSCRATRWNPVMVEGNLTPDPSLQWSAPPRKHCLLQVRTFFDNESESQGELFRHSTEASSRGETHQQSISAWPWDCRPICPHVFHSDQSGTCTHHTVSGEIALKRQHNNATANHSQQNYKEQ